MDRVTQIHTNFVGLVRETLAEMKQEITPECESFLKSSVTEMLSHLKLLLTAMLPEQIHGLILSRLSVRRENIPAEKLERLLKYANYFTQIAKTL